MKKKLLLIIPAVFLLVVIGLVIYWNPPTTPVSYKFDAVKVDFSGKEYGSYTFEITGEYIEPYFEAPRLDLKTNMFDGLWNVDTGNISNTSIFEGSPIEESLVGEFLTVDSYVFDSSANSFRGGELAFSSDFDRWCYLDDEGKVLYVGSVSGDYTLQELFDYFKRIIPSNWLPE